MTKRYVSLEDICTEVAEKLDLLDPLFIAKIFNEVAKEQAKQLGLEKNKSVVYDQGHAESTGHCRFIVQE